MRTVNEVSKLSGVSIRTLQYYDKIGLLHPTDHTEAGYRLYDDTALAKLQQILLFKELEFPLSEIKRILECADYDENKALSQQIRLLDSAFTTERIQAYAEEAKAAWGHTPQYKAFEEADVKRSQNDRLLMMTELMAIFRELGQLKGGAAEAVEVQLWVKKLKEYITENFYECTDEILRSLGTVYACGGEFTENVDRAAGEGSAKFAEKAIQAYCDRRSEN
ncbi:MerR family transcriptional regulator [Stomatobaculum longum]